MAFDPREPFDDLPPIPPAADIETKAILRLAVSARKVYSKELIELIFRKPYCRIADIVDAGIAKRQTASEYLQELERAGILAGEKAGREQVYRNVDLLRALVE
jgi:Fic family protein